MPSVDNNLIIYASRFSKFMHNYRSTLHRVCAEEPRKIETGSDMRMCVTLDCSGSTLGARQALKRNIYTAQVCQLKIKLSKLFTKSYMIFETVR